MHGSVLVAHNISFDARFLGNEYKRLGIDVDFGDGICTLRKTNQKLNIACETRGIKLNSAHRSLGDARATAQLVLKCIDDEVITSPIQFFNISGTSNPRTFRREHFSMSFDMQTVIVDSQ